MKEKKSRPHRGTLRAERIQKVLRVLRRRGWCSPFSLAAAAKVTNPAECVSALRLNGVKVEKRKVPGERYCEWRLARRAAA